MALSLEQLKKIKQGLSPDTLAKINAMQKPKETSGLPRVLETAPATAASIAKTFAEQAADFTGWLDKLSKYVGGKPGFKQLGDIGEAIGIPRRGGTFEEASKVWQSWVKPLREAQDYFRAGTGERFTGSMIGGAPLGISRFMLNVPFAAATGGMEAKERGESELAGAAIEGGKRFLLGRIFHAMAPLKRYIRMPLTGGVFAAEAAAHGGSREEIAEALGTGFFYGIGGGRTGLGVKDIVSGVKQTYFQPERLSGYIRSQEAYYLSHGFDPREAAVKALKDHIEVFKDLKANPSKMETVRLRIAEDALNKGNIARAETALGQLKLPLGIEGYNKPAIDKVVKDTTRVEENIEKVLEAVEKAKQVNVEDVLTKIKEAKALGKEADLKLSPEEQMAIIKGFDEGKIPSKLTKAEIIAEQAKLGKEGLTLPKETKIGQQTLDEVATDVAAGKLDTVSKSLEDAILNKGYKAQELNHNIISLATEKGAHKESIAAFQKITSELGEISAYKKKVKGEVKAEPTVQPVDTTKKEPPKAEPIETQLHKYVDKIKETTKQGDPNNVLPYMFGKFWERADVELGKGTVTRSEIEKLFDEIRPKAKEKFEPKPKVEPKKEPKRVARTVEEILKDIKVEPGKKEDIMPVEAVDHILDMMDKDLGKAQTEIAKEMTGKMESSTRANESIKTILGEKAEKKPEALDISGLSDRDIAIAHYLKLRSPDATTQGIKDIMGKRFTTDEGRDAFYNAMRNNELEYQWDTVSRFIKSTKELRPTKAKKAPEKKVELKQRKSYLDDQDKLFKNISEFDQKVIEGMKDAGVSEFEISRGIKLDEAIKLLEARRRTTTDETKAEAQELWKETTEGLKKLETLRVERDRLQELKEQGGVIVDMMGVHTGYKMIRDAFNKLRVRKFRKRSDAEMTKTLADLATMYRHEGKLDFNEFADTMVRRLGPEVEPFLESAWKIADVHTKVLDALIKDTKYFGDPTKIVHQREFKVGDETRKAVALTEYDMGNIMAVKGRLPYAQNFIGELAAWIETAARSFEMVDRLFGTNLKGMLHRPYHAALKNARFEFLAIKESVNIMWDSLPRDAKRRVAIYAYSKQPHGDAILKANRVEKVEKLSDAEMEVYGTMRGFLQTFFVRVNEGRQLASRQPLDPVDDYFTFMRVMDIGESLGINLIFGDKAGFDATVKAAKTPYNTYAHPTLTKWRFAKKRVYSLRPLDLNAKLVFEKYTLATLEHIHISPVVAKGRELLREIDIGGGKKFKLSDRSPEIAKFLTGWLDGIAGETKGYFREKLPRTEKVLRAFNRGLAGSILSFTLRSGIIQPSAISLTSVEIGPIRTAEGINMLKNGEGDWALKASNHLTTRQTSEVMVKEAMTGVIGSWGGTSKTANLIRQIATGKENATKFGFRGLQYLDIKTAQATWLGAYAHATKDLGMKKHSREAYDFADDVTIRTQASANIGDVSPAQRDIFGKSIFMFQTFVINQWGFQVRDIAKVGRLSAPPMNPVKFAEWYKRNETDVNEVLKKVAGFVVATTLVNIFYEDVLGITSPQPTPIREYQEAIDDGEEPYIAIFDAGMEILTFMPGLGGMRYGSSMLGAPASWTWELAKNLARYQGSKTSPGQLAAQAAGIPGTSQYMKMKRAVDADNIIELVEILKDEPSYLYEALLGVHPDHQTPLLRRLFEE